MGNRRHRSPQTQLMGHNKGLSATSLLFLGLVIGLAVGLYYAWVVDPVTYVNASPARLSAKHQHEYILLVSQTYAFDQDWTRAERRLAALDDPALAQTLSNLLEQLIREQTSPDVLRHLASLAQRAGVEDATVALFAPTPLGTSPSPATTPTVFVSPTVKPSATATAVPSPTPTILPTVTPQLLYRLVNQEQICDATSSTPLIEVITLDALLDPLPGVEVWVNWGDSSDRFFTGFKPSQGNGYGDFSMTPDVSYTVRLAQSSPEVSGLRVEECDTGVMGGWRLTFQHLTLRVVPGEAPLFETPVP